MDHQEKCPYDKTDTSLESDSSNSESPPSSKEKRSKISIFNLRKTRALHFSTKKGKKVQVQEASGSCPPVKKSPKWSIKFNCSGKKESKSGSTSQEKQQCCTCVKIREDNSSPTLSESASMTPEEPTPEEIVSDTIENVDNDDNVLPVVVEEANADVSRPNPEIPPVQVEQAEGIRGIYGISMNGAVSSVLVSAPFAEGPLRQILHVDCDEAAILARAREIEQGVEPPANFRPVKRLQVLCSDSESESSGKSSVPPRRLQLVCPSDLNVESLKALFQNHVQLRSCPIDSIAGCHTQIDFIHCLVPDLLNITNCSFYWGKMDRYEAERLLEGKQEGTFLLRDSAQEEFLFSVSFRKYGRSLHARIEQWNHRFSFDSHDPGVFTSDTVCGLIEHYKDPSSCMFFEPMLTRPLHRNFTFSLQHLARAVIVNRLTYDNINHLQLPKTLKTYLKEYHYRQKVRVERFDDDMQWLELRNVPP